MATFEALQVALELADELGPLIEIIRQHDRDMANQLKKAGTSAPSCLAEGSLRTGRDRLHLYTIASGSAGEIKVQLRLSVAWSYLTQERAARAHSLADRVVAMTFRLTHRRR